LLSSPAIPSGPQRFQEIELAAARGLCPAIRQIDDLALPLAFDRAMRRLDEAREPLRQPVIAPRLAVAVVHALLHDHPLAVIGDDEAVQVEIVAVLDRGAVDLGDQPARARQRVAVEADAIADRHEFLRRLQGVLAAAAADMQAELAGKRRQPALERADHAGGDAGGVPVHAHHGAERLEPERMGEPAQQLVAPVMMDDRFAHHRAQPGHALGQPRRHPPIVQRQIGATGSLSHSFSRIPGHARQVASNRGQNGWRDALSMATAAPYPAAKK